jgi:hypothetical protein
LAPIFFSRRDDMGTVKTAIQLRMKRARQLVKGGAVQSNGHVGHFLVHSQSGNREYDVAVHVDPETQIVMRTHCQCPDWAKMSQAMNWWIEETGRSPHPGISHIDYCPCCKHVLGVLLQTGVVK